MYWDTSRKAFIFQSQSILHKISSGTHTRVHPHTYTTTKCQTGKIIIFRNERKWNSDEKPLRKKPKLFQLTRRNGATQWILCVRMRGWIQNMSSIATKLYAHQFAGNDGSISTYNECSLRFKLYHHRLNAVVVILLRLIVVVSAVIIMIIIFLFYYCKYRSSYTLRYLTHSYTYYIFSVIICTHTICNDKFSSIVWFSLSISLISSTSFLRRYQRVSYVALFVAKHKIVHSSVCLGFTT